MLQSLVRNGILKGIRGPRGGYELARDPSGLTVPKSSNLMPESATKYFTVRETSTSSAPPICATREAMCTAIPRTSSASVSGDDGQAKCAKFTPV
jgi:DNA-binding IscR family transcriptional regulator